MPFSELAQELKDMIVGLTDQTTCAALSLVHSSLRATAQRKVFDTLLINGNERFNELIALVGQSKYQRLFDAIVHAKTIELREVNLDLADISAFQQVRSMRIVDSTLLLPDWHTFPLTGIFSHLSCLAITHSSDIPLQFFYGLKALCALELREINITGPDMTLTEPLPDHPRLHTLKLDRCRDARMPALLLNVLDCTCIKVLECGMWERVQGDSNEDENDNDDDDEGAADIFVHKLVLDVAKSSLESVTLRVLQSWVSDNYFYEWEQVPNLKHFGLIVSEDPSDLTTSLDLKEESVSIILDNLESVARIQPNMVERITLTMHDFYENSAIPIGLPDRCNFPLSRWKHIGEALVNISRAQQRNLHVHIDLQAFDHDLYAPREPDCSAPNMADIEPWFAECVVTSSLDRRKIDLTTSSMHRTIADYRDAYVWWTR